MDGRGLHDLLLLNSAENLNLGQLRDLASICGTSHPVHTRNRFLASLRLIQFMLKESLAASLRCDASVDRTQNHNLLIIVKVVAKEDTTVKTLCLGYYIP